MIYPNKWDEVWRLEKILIVDTSDSWRRTLTSALGHDHRVVGCTSGKQALALLQEFHPDVLILDLMLPENDGLSVLDQVESQLSRPSIIITSRYFSDYLLMSLDRYRVEYAALKPCSVESMVDRVRDLLNQRRSEHATRLDPRHQVNAVLRTLSVPTSQNGYHYVRDGILLLMEQPNQQLTKSLYPAIAMLHGTNAMAVEKAIRTAVSTAWNRRSDAEWRRYFHCAPSGQVPKPTSGQFMSRIADALVTQGENRAAGGEYF